MNDFSRWLSKLTSISADIIESWILGGALAFGVWFLFGLFNVPNIGLIMGSITGSLYGTARFWRVRHNLRKPTPVEYMPKG